MRWHVVFPAAALVVVAVMGNAFPATGGDASLNDLSRWADGPIHYIATRAEMRAFQKLKTDEDRIAFIERFWELRDPTPETLHNEYRQIFWERVRKANETFTDAPGPGWKTDRGKIYILYGEPTDIQEDLSARPLDGPGQAAGVIRWIYQGRPGGRKDLDNIVVVPFVRDVSGEYRLSTDPRLASIFYNFLAARGDSSLTWQRWKAQNLGFGRSDLAVMADLGRLQEIPPQEEMLLARVSTTEAVGTHPLPTSVERFRYPNRDGLLVVLTVAIPDTQGSTRPALMARFTPRDATRKQRILGEGSFRVDGSGRARLAQARMVLPPGTWDLLILAAEPEEGTTGIYRGTVRVPGRRQGLDLSDPVLARTVEPLRYAALVSYDEPFTLGAFRVVPLPDRRISPGEPATVFIEVYEGAPPFQVTYHLEGKDNDGSWVSLGRPAETTTSERAIGWKFSTGVRWPPGEYRVQLSVTDSGGAHTATRVSFLLDPALLVSRSQTGEPSSR